MKLKIVNDKIPAGDQPKAIKKLVKNLKDGADRQTLLGVTGSGKTFTIANVIEKYQKPTLVIAHNKTLAAQLAQEFKELFPNNIVHYFVSYYDYYQPEAYVPTSDTYIEKTAQINAEIDRLRHATTQSLLTRDDVIVVASVSAIYGLGSPERYLEEHIKVEKNSKLSREELIKKMVGMYFERTKGELVPGTINVLGEYIEIVPVNEEVIYRVRFDRDKISEITKIDFRTRAIIGEVDVFFLFPAKHFVTSKAEQEKALNSIKLELDERLPQLDVLEAERLRRRTLQDIALIEQIGYCTGIENYSRHFDGRKPGEAPYTLMSYFPKDFLVVVDESHVTIPQISGMYAGDRARKDTLVRYGYRLPSAVDNRPLTFDEFDERAPHIIFTSATPADYEKEVSKNIIEQIIRPTGLVDPFIEVHPITSEEGQVPHFISAARESIDKGGRVLVTTLTKKTAEDLSVFLSEAGLAAEYIHSDVQTMDRIEILTRFRKGEFDILVGVNLLREGLDLPEVTLVAILDADKEGFLRSETSLVQTIGRAARNVDGKVLLYADNVTGSLKRAIDETQRRRELQIAHNTKHGITPQTIKKSLVDITAELVSKRKKTVDDLLIFDKERYLKAPKKVLKEKRDRMKQAVEMEDFETAAIIRDEISVLEGKI